MKTKLTWKQLLLASASCYFIAKVALLPFSYTAYPFFEIGRALTASFEIGGLLTLILGIFEAVKIVGRKNK